MKNDKKKSAEVEVAAAEKKSNKTLYAILGVILIAAIVGGGYWWYSQPKKPTDYKNVTVGTAKSPTEAYQMLFAAVKSKDPAKIKMMMSENSLGFAEFVAGQQKKTVEEVLANGFTATTFSETMPTIRDERIKDGFGAVEVINNQKQWEDLPFINETLISIESAGANREAVLAIVKDDLKVVPDKAEQFINSLPQTVGGFTDVQAENIRQKLIQAGATASIKNIGWKLAIGDMFKGTYQKPSPGQSVREQEAANAVNNNMIEINPNANANNANVEMIIPKNSGTMNKNMKNPTLGNVNK